MKYLLVSGDKNRFLIIAFALFAFVGGCSVAEPRTSADANTVTRATVVNSTGSAPRGATIEIEQGGPADTVRAFYKLLREKKFREAMFLTNLRPAIESLTDAELSDFSLDFAELAGQVPAEVEINGEIVSGDQATVTAVLPNDDGDKNELQTIKLRKEGEHWVIMTADEETAKRIKAEGKDYFYKLRIDTHEEEAKRMLERISKAQLAHSFQNGGLVTDMETLIAGGLLPGDIRTSESTGYDYKIELSGDKRKYHSTATPAVYRKSGIRSFILTLDAKGVSHVNGKDNAGKALKP